MRAATVVQFLCCVQAFKAPIFKPSPTTWPASRPPRPAVRVEPMPLPPPPAEEVDESAVGYDLWWQGNSTEYAAPLKLQVNGELPTWLKGSLVRVGPGMFEVGGQTLQHQMDGLAKLTKFQISDSMVHFQTRMLGSKLYNRTGAGHRAVSRFTMLPVQPALNAVERVRAVLNEPEADNTNIVVWRMGKQAQVCSDTTCASNAFDIDTLAARGHTRVGTMPSETEAARKASRRKMSDATMTGAHKQRVINGTASVGWVGHVETDINNLQVNTVINIYKDHPRGEETHGANGGDGDEAEAHREFIGQLKLPVERHGLPMIHSFQVTKRFVILVVCSLCVEPALIGSKLLVLSEAFAGVQTLGWRERQNTTVFVMDIESTDPEARAVRTFSIDPMYMNHHINAWEEATEGEGEGGEGGVVMMDLIAYRDGSFLSDRRGFGNLEVMRDPTERAHLKALKPTVRRYTLDLRLDQHPEAHSAAPTTTRAAAAEEATSTSDPLETVERLTSSRLRPSTRVLHAPWVAFDLQSSPLVPTPAEEWPQLESSDALLDAPLDAPLDVDAAARPTPTGSLHIEMPRFNERRHGRPYRYVWGVGAPLSVPTHVTGLVKVDMNDPNRHSVTDGAKVRGASKELNGEVDGVPAYNAACVSWCVRRAFLTAPSRARPLLILPLTPFPRRVLH